MIVQGVNLNLKVRIVVQQGWVAVPCTFQFLSHVHNLVLLRPDFTLEILDGGCQFHVPGRFWINSLLEILVFISVFLLQALEVVELILEANYLILELDDLSFAVDELSLLIFQIIGFWVDQLVEVVDPGELFRDVVLQLSRLGSKICRLFTLAIVLVVESIDFLGILSISLPKIVELILEVLLLGQELSVEVLVGEQLRLESRYFHVARV
jgi:hypothetical protein